MAKQTKLYKLDRSYKKQDGCWNCKWFFEYKDLDINSKCFCSANNGERPLCGSVEMNEPFNRAEQQMLKEQRAMWEHWTNGRRINQFGICKLWIRKKRTENEDTKK
jgi:hypothetical protein